MPVFPLPEFAKALAEQGALLGLDPGAKRIGVSVSDATRTIASPIATIHRTKFAKDANEIFELYDKRACLGVVVGLPLNMNGSSGPAAQAIRAFARNLLAVRDAPLLLWDERLSTAAVTRALLEADATRARRSAVVDKLAAAYLLQGALDAMREGASAAGQ